MACANKCGREASVVCAECSGGILLCEACFGVIHACHALRNHVARDTLACCTTHRQPFTVNCGTCEAAVCVECAISAHRQHRVKLIGAKK
jgi:hypothetical protein